MNNSGNLYEFEERPNIITIILAVLIIIMSVIPFIKNYKYNDNHLNYLNSEYCRNLLMTASENSVFMTEGGDNQVFGSLYFIYAEKLRPDISPYDQKGNIFKRIYGDLRYSYDDLLSRRISLVDSGIFQGEEPFYENIRDVAPPYFIPYWQGVRPVYLTWQKTGLYTLGDYYYKRYGIMYKLTDVEYSIVDYLEYKKTATLYKAMEILSNYLGRPVDYNYAVTKINKITAEGYISFDGYNLYFIKPVLSPEKDKFLSKYKISWKSVPNAKYFDFLTKEIIVNYDFELGEAYRNKVYELRELQKNEYNPEIISNMENEIDKCWATAKEYYKDALYYGDDSISILHNISIVYLNNNIEDMGIEARDILTNVLSRYKNSYETYSLIFGYLVNDAYGHPEREESNLVLFDKFMLQLKQQLSYYTSSGGIATNHSLWENFEGIEQLSEVIKQNPGLTLSNNIIELDRQINESPFFIENALAQRVIVSLYSRGMPMNYNPYIEKADELFAKINSYKMNDRAWLPWAFQIALQIQRYPLAYSLGKSLQYLDYGMMGFDNIYYMGVTCYYMTNYWEARVYFNKFLLDVKKDPKASVDMRQMIEQANSVLTSLNKQGVANRNTNNEELFE